MSDSQHPIHWIFPADERNGYSVNYRDSVNASWYSSDSLAGALMSFQLWTLGSNDAIWGLQTNDTINTSTSGFNIYSNFLFNNITYPVKAHFGLSAIFPNGTTVWSHDSNELSIDLGLGADTNPQCHNCTSQASASIAGVQPPPTFSLSTVVATVTVTPTELPVQPSSGMQLGGGLIAGIVLIALVVLALISCIVWLLFFRGRRRPFSRKVRRREEPGGRPMMTVQEMPDGYVRTAEVEDRNIALQQLGDRSPGELGGE